MTEAVVTLLYEPVFCLISGGFAIGSIVSAVSGLLGYAVTRALSLVDNT